VGWLQAATGRVAAAFFGEKPCNRTFRGLISASWRRSRAPEAGHLGKIGYKRSRGQIVGEDDSGAVVVRGPTGYNRPPVPPAHQRAIP
jgi:hypothetical protein